MKTFSFCKGILLLAVYLFSIILLLSASIGFAEKSTLSLNVKDSVVELKTEMVPLVDILKAISDRTGVSLMLDESMTEPISMELKAPIEECFQRLLEHENYVMVYSGRKDGQVGLSEVYVISSGSTARYGGALGAPENPIKQFQGNRFLREVLNDRGLSGQIAAVPLAGEGEERGLRVTRVSKNSFFEKIGLREGDTIHSVIGKPVSSVDEFIQGLGNAYREENQIIMIERLTRDQMIRPIYIHLE